MNSQIRLLFTIFRWKRAKRPDARKIPRKCDGMNNHSGVVRARIPGKSRHFSTLWSSAFTTHKIKNIPKIQERSYALKLSISGTIKEALFIADKSRHLAWAIRAARRNAASSYRSRFFFPFFFKSGLVLNETSSSSTWTIFKRILIKYEVLLFPGCLLLQPLAVYGPKWAHNLKQDSIHQQLQTNKANRLQTPRDKLI